MEDGRLGLDTVTVLDIRKYLFGEGIGGCKKGRQYVFLDLELVMLT